MSNENFSNMRNSERISGDALPEKLRKLKLTYNETETIDVDTIDASKTGIAVKVPLASNVFVDFDIILTSMDGEIVIEDEIAYVKSIDSNCSRVSVKFSKNTDIDKYLELF